MMMEKKMSEQMNSSDIRIFSEVSFIVQNQWWYAKI